MYSPEFVQAVENTPARPTAEAPLRDETEPRMMVDMLLDQASTPNTTTFKLRNSPFQRFSNPRSRSQSSPTSTLSSDRKPSPKPPEEITLKERLAEQTKPTLKDPPTYAAAAAQPAPSVATMPTPPAVATLQQLKPPPKTTQKSPPISLLKPFSNPGIRSPPKAIRTVVEQNLISPNERFPATQLQDDPRWKILDEIKSKQQDQEATIVTLRDQLQQKENQFETTIAALRTRIQQQEQELQAQSDLIETLKTDQIENLRQTIQNQLALMMQQKEETELQGIQDAADTIVAECGEEIARMSDIVNDHKTEWFAAIDEKKAELDEVFDEIQEFKDQGHLAFTTAMQELQATSTENNLELAQIVMSRMEPQLIQIINATATQRIEAITRDTIQASAQTQFNVLNSSMETRRREIDSRLATAVDLEVRRTKGEIGMMVQQAITRLEGVFDSLQNSAISNLDAAPAFYNELAEECGKELKKKLPGQLQQTYDNFVGRSIINFEHKLNSEMDQREQSFKTRLHNKIEDSLHDPVIQAQITSLADSKLGELDNRLAAVNTSVKDSTETIMATVTQAITDLETKAAEELVDISKGVADGKRQIRELGNELQEQIDTTVEQVEASMATVQATKAEVETLLQQVEDARRQAVQQKKKNKKSRDKYKKKKKVFNFGTSPTNGNGGGDDGSDPDDSGDDGGGGGDNSDGGSDEERSNNSNPPPARQQPLARGLFSGYKDRIKKFTKDYHDQNTLSDIKDMDDVENFYKALAQYTNTCNLPMLDLDSLTVEHPTSISQNDIAELDRIDPTLANMISGALYSKLIAQFSGANPKVKSILKVHHKHANGYKAAYDLVQNYSDLLDPYATTRWGPPWPRNATVRSYASSLIHLASRDGRQHTEEDMMLELLLQARPIERLASITNAFLANIELFGKTCLRNTTFFRLIHLLSEVSGDSTRFDMEDPDFDPTIDKLVINKVDNNSKQPRRWAKHSVQCTICHQYGHSPEMDHICYTSAQIFHVMKYMHHLDIEKIPKEPRALLETNATKYHNYNTPKTVKKRLIGHSIDIDTLTEDEYLKTDSSYSPEQRVTVHVSEGFAQPSLDEIPFADKVEHSIPEQGTGTAEPASLAINKTLEPTPETNDDSDADILDVDELRSSLHPFHLEKAITALSPHSDIWTPRNLRPSNVTIRKASHRHRLIEILESSKRRHVQGDTGANVSATNDITILWNFQPLAKPINITTYDGNNSSPCQAVGRGIIKIVANDNSVLEFEALYIPNSTGTIISPDHFMQSRQDIESFTHFGSKSGRGHMQFGDINGCTVTRIDMTRSDGLWYTTNKIVENPQPTLPIPIDDKEEWKYIVKKCRVNSAKEYKTLELWHQRYGHIGNRALAATSQCVEGMPPIPSDTSHFACPFCDQAKIKKSPGAKEATKETIFPGADFHMDVGFISGSREIEILEDFAAEPTKKKRGRPRKKTKTEKVTGRQGHTCFLLIICAATRYIWAFPLKSKQPPVDIIDKFLERHGAAHNRQTKKISTSPNGALAKSKSFALLMAKRDYETVEQPFDMDLDFEPMNTATHFTIRTDNGGELAKSEQIQEVCAKHGYNLETTAPGTSRQNGLAERPNRTLKERVRCLLYTANLGAEFWADALLHAVWLYNRTYHRWLGRTPFEAYTGRRPYVDKLITFGGRITAKSSADKRTDALDKFSHVGIFLGFGATTEKIKYWDEVNQNEKFSSNHVTDEIHYGTEPQKRPTANTPYQTCRTEALRHPSMDRRRTPTLSTNEDTIQLFRYSHQTSWTHQIL